jgi:preprotein translocase subunit SecG
VTVLLVILYVLVCIFLILVVLLQQGKGADLAGAFGGGGSQTSFGPRSASNIMHRLTTASFVLFVVMSLALAILSGKQRTSVMESVEIPAAEATETGAAETGMAAATDGDEPATGDTAVPEATDPPEEAAEDPGTGPAENRDEAPKTE